MSDYRCATCKGRVEGTRKHYVTLEGGAFAAAGLGDVLDAYCENDCWHEAGLDGVDDVAGILDQLVDLGHVERGAPDPQSVAVMKAARRAT